MNDNRPAYLALMAESLADEFRRQALEVMTEHGLSDVEAGQLLFEACSKVRIASVARASGAVEHVGRNLRKIRRSRDLTQSQVARLAGLRQKELSAIERGLRPSLAVVDRLALALGVHPNELIAP